jgi:NAD-dependent SIR2 family protein deacetylase
MTEYADEIERAVRLVRGADGILVTAGAGMGVDSGLPDFRGGEGLWRDYPKLKHLTIRFEEIANPHGFLQNPRLAWGWYAHRIQSYRATEPHPGYRMVREIAELAPRGYFCFTSNVDGHFQKSGWPLNRITDCHGSLFRLQCSEKCNLDIWHVTDDFQPQVDLSDCSYIGHLPICPHCHALLRPNVLLFNDHLYNQVYSNTEEHRLEQWLDTCKNVVVIEIGAGEAVPTVRWFGQWRSESLIRINTRDPVVHRITDVSLPVGGLQGISDLHTALGLD